MGFQPNIPLPTDLLSNSQVTLKTNNQALDSVFAVNHYNYSLNTGVQGKHKFVEMPVQSIPTIASGEAAIYADTSGQSQLFGTTDTGNNPYQLTRMIDASFPSFSTNLAYTQITPFSPAVISYSGGWTFLPGGLLMQYGTVQYNATLNVAQTIPYPVAFTTGVFSFSVIKLANAAITSYAVNTTLSNQSFNLYASNTNLPSSVFWTAIGK